ncbi:hypothetical protein PgNI_06138 [Pyricularia grisea]|uniref:Secreted protein n=1 Tax=Pyricularia grisea TaxID=148305 RepID=A0A6P8B7R3_PYRGI|nr:hypothetical protein PgNI_06138 [Pyricularia grisea]TLD11366.1 hypothetical protein PgNI_06138 [Pyricularia grisea]
MKWLAASAALILAAHVSAIAVDPSLGTPPQGYEMCTEAFNCEAYKDAEGRWAMRIIPGLEYGSAGYEEHVNKTRVGPEKQDLVSRQEYFNCGNAGYCTGVGSSEDKQEFGDATPKTVAESLWSHCKSFHCNVDSWTWNMKHAHDGSVQVPLPRTLTISTTGTFHPDIQKGMLSAVTEVYGRTQTQVTRRGGTPRFGQWQMKFWQAPSRVNVARFNQKSKGLDGFLTSSITWDKSGNFGCAQINAALGPAAAAIRAAGGPLMGIVNLFCQ